MAIGEDHSDTTEYFWGSWLKPAFSCLIRKNMRGLLLQRLERRKEPFGTEFWAKWRHEHTFVRARFCVEFRVWVLVHFNTGAWAQYLS